MIPVTCSLAEHPWWFEPDRVLSVFRNTFSVGRCHGQNFRVIIKLNSVARLQFEFGLSQSPLFFPWLVQPDSSLDHCMFNPFFWQTTGISQELKGFCGALHTKIAMYCLIVIFQSYTPGIDIVYNYGTVHRAPFWQILHDQWFHRPEFSVKQDQRL